jgi:putative ABC transport system substrate-binding protein
MRRRELITLLGGVAAAWPLAAGAQQPAVPVVGYLSSESPELFAERANAVRQGLGEIGYAEGRNVTIEHLWADGQYDRLPALAAEFVRRRVAVIVADGGLPGARAAKAATKTIPIVFSTGVDPVAFGVVASLNRPGGNITGVSTLADELGPKRLELLREVVPTATVFGLLTNPTNPNSEAQEKGLQTAARTLGVQLHVVHASSDHEFETALATLAGLRVQGLVIGPDTFYRGARHNRIAALAAQNAIPTAGFLRDFTVAGGLMSYAGNSGMEALRLVGVYTGRILKGEKPADLPVLQPTKFELVINLKTAKTLGLIIPLTLQYAADEVIE